MNDRGDQRTLVIGEALIDAVHRPGAQVQEHVGGSPANVAFGLAALDHAVDLATWIADDERGHRISSVCDERGVRLTAGSRSAAATSVAHADLDSTGAATYRFELEWQLAPVDAIASYDHVHSGSIAAVLAPGAAAVHETLVAARPAATISYDPNARPSLMGAPEQARLEIERVVALADVVKVSDEDLEWLRPGESVDDVARDWATLGPSLIVVTRGAHGASALLARTGEMRHLPAPTVTVVDTVGAGDSFMAGLLSGLFDARLIGGAPARERLQASELSDLLPAVERGLATAALTVERAGAHAPGRADLA